MIGRTNAVSKPGVELSLVVSVTSGAAVTATKGSKTVNGTAAGGSCVLSLPEAGTWSVKATLNGQTSDTKSVSVVDSYAVALTFFSATITVNVDSGASVTLKKGGTTIATKTSNGTAVFTVTETGAYTVTATKNGQTTSGSVNVVSGTTSYSLTLSFVSSTLNNNEWSVIKSVSDAGQGANYWSIGDPERRSRLTARSESSRSRMSRPTLSLSALTIMQASRAQTASIFSLQRPRSPAVRTCVSAIINMARIADGRPRVRAISL